MILRKAKPEEAIDCLECVKYSLLWDAYFADDPTPSLVEEEIRQGRVTVALDDEQNCIGFMSIRQEGLFGKFPYLAILSVHERFRNKGVGKKLLQHFEKEGFDKAERLFILCSDFNTKGQRFYKKNGYTECGRISDLFKRGITEHLFVKYKEHISE